MQKTLALKKSLRDKIEFWEPDIVVGFFFILTSLDSSDAICSGKTYIALS